MDTALGSLTVKRYGKSSSDTRKIIVENGGKHPASLTSLLDLSRKKGGRGLRSVEHEYKITQIKSLLKLYQNSDQTVEAGRKFE